MASMKAKWATGVVTLAASLMTGGAAFASPPSGVEGFGHSNGLFPAPIEETRAAAVYATREAQRQLRESMKDLG